MPFFTFSGIKLPPHTLFGFALFIVGCRLVVTVFDRGCNHQEYQEQHNAANDERNDDRVVECGIYHYRAVGSVGLETHVSVQIAVFRYLRYDPVRIDHDDEIVFRSVQRKVVQRDLQRLIVRSFVAARNGTVIKHRFEYRSPVRDAVVTDIGNYLEESMKVTEKNGYLKAISKTISKEDALGCSIDVYKFSVRGGQAFYDKCKEYIETKKELKLWSEVALNDIFDKVNFKACPLKGRWFEIDNHDDLAAAEKLFGDHC